jgi:uncharacterized protein YcaQ
VHRLTKARARRIAIRAQLLDAQRPTDLLTHQLVGKLDAIVDRKASVLRVHAIHEDVRFTRTMTKAVQAELEDLASWLGLSAAELLEPPRR